MKRFFNKKTYCSLIIALLLSSSVIAVEDNNTTLQAKQTQKSKFKLFSKDKKNKEVNLEKQKKPKKIGVTEVVLPEVTSMRRLPEKFSIMTIDNCVDYAITHNPNLFAAESRITAAKSGIGIQKTNFAPRLTARVGYNHNTNNGTRIVNSHQNSLGFNAGISQLIWDFGKTIAKINMTKYNTKSVVYDYEFEILNIVYDVKINYYKVLMALANLDIYEQNVRINTLNFERTKAMFDEGLKSKIDVVNAEVNLADSKILLVEGQKAVATAVIDLKNSMYFQDTTDFIVKNTENFGFLKADYKKKMQNLEDTKNVPVASRKNEDGLIMLSSGIEHSDIIQNYVLEPLKITKQDAVDKALELRPDLKSIRMISKVQEESLKAIKRQFAPELAADLTWSYTKNESTYSSPFQVGASMGFGSINPYQLHYQIQEGEAYLDIANHNLNIAKSDIYWEVQNNYINMRQLERKIPLMNQKVKATLENFELADGRYSVGLNNYVELQDALANYNTSQLNFVEAVFEYNVARETLLKSMGIRGDKMEQNK